MKFFRPFILFLALATSQAQASTRQYFLPDYYLGEFVKIILRAASSVNFPEYQVLNAPLAHQKAQSALQSIYRTPAFDYTYDALTIYIIQGVEDQPNAFCFGANMFVTKSLVDILNPQELTAVLAHELAHSEKAHNLQKTPLPLEAAIYQLNTILVAVKNGQWPTGKDLVDSMKDLMATGGLAMELQADCVAAQQLLHMQKRGLPNQVTDLIQASNKILGYDVTLDTSEDPAALRARALLSGSYRDGCDMF